MKAALVPSLTWLHTAPRRGIPVPNPVPSPCFYTLLGRAFPQNRASGNTKIIYTIPSPLGGGSKAG